MSTQTMVQVQKAKRPAIPAAEFTVPSSRATQEQLAIRLAHGIKTDRYRLGQVLAAIISSDETSYMGGKYTTFQQFCRHELEISAGYGRQLAQITENYTLQQFRQFGVSKLRVLLTGIQNQGDRKRALAMLQEGKTLVEVARVFVPGWKRTIANWKQGRTVAPAGFQALKTAALKLNKDERFALAAELLRSVKSVTGKSN